MTNWRGTTVQAGLVQASREHRERLRQLEPNPSGEGGVDGPWHTIGDPGEPPFATSWVRADGNVGSDTAPPQFMIDRHSVVRMRGSIWRNLANFPWNDDAGSYPFFPVMTFPVGYRPSAGGRFFAISANNANNFSVDHGMAGSQVGHAYVSDVGVLSVRVNQTGLASTEQIVLDTMTPGTEVALRTTQWRNANGNVFGYKGVGGGGFGIVSGGTISGDPPGALCLSTSPWGDQQLSVIWRSATRVAVGLRCQPWQFDPANQPRPSGYWVIYQQGGTYNVYYQDGRGLHLIDGPIGGPSMASGDQLRCAISNYRLAVFKNGAFITSHVMQPYIYGQGLYGLGTSGVATSGVHLVDTLTGGLPLESVICLDQVAFNTV